MCSRIVIVFDRQERQNDFDIRSIRNSNSHTYQVVEITAPASSASARSQVNTNVAGGRWGLVAKIHVLFVLFCCFGAGAGECHWEGGEERGRKERRQ